jgi:hypothetical protein
VQPDVFDEMDVDEGADFAMRVMKFHIEDIEIMAKLVEEHAKATMKAMGARIM